MSLEVLFTQMIRDDMSVVLRTKKLILSIISSKLRFPYNFLEVVDETDTKVVYSLYIFFW